MGKICGLSEGRSRNAACGTGQYAGGLRSDRIERIAAVDALVIIRLVLLLRAAAAATAARFCSRADRAAQKPTAAVAIPAAAANAAEEYARLDELATRLPLEPALGRSFARGARAAQAAAGTGPRQIDNDELLLLVVVLFEALQTVLFVAQPRLGGVGLFRVDFRAVRELRGRTATLALMAAGAAVKRARRPVQQHLLVDAERYRRVHRHAALGRPRVALVRGRVAAAVVGEKLRAIAPVAAVAATATRPRVPHVLHGGVAKHAHQLREQNSEKKQGGQTKAGGG